MQTHLFQVQNAYLYLFHNGNKIDRLVMHWSDSKAHIDYSIDPNAMGMRMWRRNIGRVHCMICTIRGTFYMFALVNRSTEHLSIPYIGHRRAWSEMGKMYKPVVQHLKRDANEAKLVWR